VDDVLQIKVAKARQLAQRLKDDGELDAAYVGGSIAAGFGNPTSDADLFALRRHHGEGPRVVQFNAGGDRIDVEFYTYVEADEMLDRIGTLVPAADNLQLLGETKDALDWHSRLLQSIDAIDSPDLARLHARAEEVRPSAQRLAVSHWILFSDSMAEDFRGALEAGQTATAVYASQQMLAYAGKGLVTALGDLYFPAKWVFEQVARTSPDHVGFADFYALQTGRWADGDIPDGSAPARATQFLAGCATLEILVPGSTSDLRRSADIGGPRRDRVAVPIPMVDRALLHFELQRQVILPPLVFAVWLLCDGRSEEDLLAGVRHVVAASGSSREFEPEALQRILASLRDQALLF